VSEAAGVDDARAYLRFGELPADGRSSMLLGLRLPSVPLEDGVSVFAAERTDRGWTALVGDADVSRGLLGVFLSMVCARRPVYLAHGRVVGEGGDGEPLLAEATLEEIPPEVPIYASPSLPLVDFWTALYNGWRIGGLYGFSLALSLLREHFDVGAMMEVLGGAAWVPGFPLDTTATMDLFYEAQDAAYVREMDLARVHARVVRASRASGATTRRSASATAGSGCATSTGWSRATHASHETTNAGPKSSARKEHRWLRTL
jgi:hypothetical protein